MDIKDLVGIGKTVKTVSDAVRGAVATLYRPRAIRNEGRASADVAAYEMEALARAKARAALIEQQGAAELEERAKQRFLFELSTQQESLDRIFRRAIELSSGQRKEEKGRPISEHWLYRLMINSKDVTNEEIQDIFAKLIVDQGSADKKPISYMTLDALRLFEPRHAQYFRAFCQLFYLFGGVYFGLRDAEGGLWIGDEQFDELEELGITHDLSVDRHRLRLRDFSIEVPEEAHYNFQSIFGRQRALSLRGIELSKALYPDVANQYWHCLRKDLKKQQHESVLSNFISAEAQYQCFRDLFELLSQDDTSFSILVHPWKDPYKKQHRIIDFDGERLLPSRPASAFYVPQYLKRFLDEVGTE